MFDDIPVHAWILLAIAAVAFAPARYLLQHIAHSSARRDITKPPEDLSWRTSAALVRSAVSLAALAMLAIFIFTPAAEEFAQSALFMPSLLAAFSAWAVFSVARALWTGRIEPIARGFNNTYQRQAHPRRFWASLLWNALLGCFCIWLSFESYKEASAQLVWNECADERDANSVQDKLAACNETVRLYPQDPGAFINRGLLYLDNEFHEEAAADFGRAHALYPEDPLALANRGLAYAWQGDQDAAEADFDRVRTLDHDNIVMLRGEALLSINTRELNTAADRLTALLDRYPEDRWSLQMRHDVYRRLGDEPNARADRATLLRLLKEDQARAAAK